MTQPNEQQTTEYHRYSIQKGDQTQEFVFTTTRFTDTIGINEVWLTVKQPGVEDIKTRINLHEIAEHVGNKPNGNMSPDQIALLHQQFAEQTNSEGVVDVHEEPETTTEPQTNNHLILASELVAEGYLDVYMNEYDQWVTQLVKDMRK
jgi:hypothetical protein